MKKITLATAGALTLAAATMSPAVVAEDLTLCWAAWDPANALVEPVSYTHLTLPTICSV